MMESGPPIQEMLISTTWPHLSFESKVNLLAQFRRSGTWPRILSQMVKQEANTALDLWDEYNDRWPQSYEDLQTTDHLGFLQFFQIVAPTKLAPLAAWLAAAGRLVAEDRLYEAMGTYFWRSDVRRALRQTKADFFDYRNEEGNAFNSLWRLAFELPSTVRNLLFSCLPGRYSGECVTVDALLELAGDALPDLLRLTAGRKEPAFQELQRKIAAEPGRYSAEVQEQLRWNAADWSTIDLSREQELEGFLRSSQRIECVMKMLFNIDENLKDIASSLESLENRKGL